MRTPNNCKTEMERWAWQAGEEEEVEERDEDEVYEERFDSCPDTINESKFSG